MPEPAIALGEISLRYHEPPTSKVHAAKLAIAEALNTYPEDIRCSSNSLITDLRDSKAILEPALEWAVLRLIEAGHIEAFRINPPGEREALPCSLLFPPGNLYLRALPSLYEWWRTADAAGADQGRQEQSASPFTIIAPHNPFRDLLQFAFRAHEEEHQRLVSFGINRREDPSEWGPRFRQQEADLKAIVRVALCNAEKTGYSVPEV